MSIIEIIGLVVIIVCRIFVLMSSGMIIEIIIGMLMVEGLIFGEGSLN